VSQSAVVSVTHGQVDEVTDLDPLVDGQPPTMLSEFEFVNQNPAGPAYLPGRWPTERWTEKT
jgi:hypothetical protein